MNVTGNIQDISAETVPPDEESYVYMFYSAGKVKIGTTKDPIARLDKLQNSSAEVIQIVWVGFGGRSREGDLHKRFRADRLHGEWFRLSDDIRAFIEAASTEQAPFSLMLEYAERPPAFQLKKQRDGLQRALAAGERS